MDFIKCLDGVKTWNKTKLGVGGTRAQFRSFVELILMGLFSLGYFLFLVDVVFRLLAWVMVLQLLCMVRVDGLMQNLVLQHQS